MSESLKNYGKKSDLTCKVFSQEILEEVELSQSLFLHTVFKDCRFINVNFQFSDFEGCEFKNSHFISCEFSNSDIRSVAMIECEFSKCNFEHIHLNDIQPTKSIFNDCSFCNSTILGAIFIDSQITSCKFTWATVLHCKFLKCQIINTRIAECTFLYHIFENVELIDVKMNVDSLGYQYGLTKNQIFSTKLIYLSEEQVGIASDLMDRVRDEFLLRKWFMAAILLSITIEELPMLYCVEKIIDNFELTIKNNLCLKRDETKFLSEVLSYLRLIGNVPLRAIQYGGNKISYLLEKEKLSFLNKDILSELQTNFFIIANNLIDEFDAIISKLDAIDEVNSELLMTISYSKRPSITISNLLNNDFSYLTSESMESRLIKEWAGSWYEIIALSTATITALLTSTAIIKGILRQFLDIKIIYKALREPIRIPADFKNELIRDALFKRQIKPISKNKRRARDMLGRGIDANIANIQTLLGATDEATRYIENITLESNNVANKKNKRLK